MGKLVDRGLRRAIVMLGCDSDPRFLAGIPAALPFRRVTWLRLAVPSYRGRILGGADMAYVFGDFGAAYKGQVVWPGEIVASTPRAREMWKTKHPCPRRMEHVRGLLVGLLAAAVDELAAALRTRAASWWRAPGCRPAQLRRCLLGLPVSARAAGRILVAAGIDGAGGTMA